MQALASVMLDQRWRLTGSDRTAHVPEWLARRGVLVYSGHDPAHVSPQTSLLIHSDAISADNVERRRAAELGIEQKSYPQVLGEWMADRVGVAVAGTHGKSTTVAMLGFILERAGLDPTVIGGGALLEADAGGRAGQGNLLVAEACEYRSNFLRLSPRLAAILNVEHDHFDCFPTLADVEAAYRAFAQRVDSAGLLLVQAGCPRALACAGAARCRLVTFGLGAGAEWRGSGLRHARGRYSFSILHQGQDLGRITLRVPGRHNVSNALAAAALAAELGVGMRDILEALAGFRGLRRRLEFLGSWDGVDFWDDYAHHPTEVRAALHAVRRVYPGRRLWCIFQPHQESRTRCLLDEFAASLHNVDVLVLADVFRAREPAAVSSPDASRDLAARARQRGVHVLGIHRWNDITDAVHAGLAPGDVVVSMGAGDVGKVCHELVGRLRKHRATG